METIAIPKQEYDLLLKLKKNKDFTSISFSKKKNLIQKIFVG